VLTARVLISIPYLVIDDNQIASVYLITLITILRKDYLRNG
jgi:hypothetical protein